MFDIRFKKYFWWKELKLIQVRKRIPNYTGKISKIHQHIKQVYKQLTETNKRILHNIPYILVNKGSFIVKQNYSFGVPVYMVGMCLNN